MNQEIKQLAEQAGIHDDVCRGCPIHELDKFALLIVREMLKTCEEHPEWSGHFIGEQIKEHFGVESHNGVVSTDVSKHFGVEE
jgi:hypothetical protein